jgi:hypothetical protein
LRIKGRVPRLDYPFTFADIYASTAAGTWASTTAPLRRLVAGFWASTGQPRAGPDPASLLETLLCPVALDGPGDSRRPPSIARSPKHTVLQLSRAPTPKLAHTFGWIDTNLKLRSEDLSLVSRLPDEAARRGCELAAGLYSALLRFNNHELGQVITFNESVFLQERAVDVVFGAHATAFVEIHGERAERLNHAAHVVASDWRTRGLPELLALAVASGGVLANLVRDGEVLDAPSDDDLGRRFGIALDGYLAGTKGHRPVDFDAFVHRLGLGKAVLGWIFDDNGESILDLLFLERALEETPVDLVMICNAVPVSENITGQQLRRAIMAGGFRFLERAICDGRASIFEEPQYLAGLEPAWLRPATRAAFHGMDYALLKGANIYESFQDPGLDAYYGFVVLSPNSIRLTDRVGGEPVLIHSPRGHVCH